MIRAGFWRRVLALAIDALIVFIPWYVALILIATLLDRVDMWNEHSERMLTILFYVPWLLYSGLEIRQATTVGKRAMSMQITRADGAPADRWTLVVRYIGKHYPIALLVMAAATGNALLSYLAGLGLLIVGIGCLYALCDHKRAWHDEWAGTAVALRQPARSGFSIQHNASGDLTTP